MSVAQHAQALTTLAASRTPGDRERLLSAIISLCDRPEAEALMRQQAIQELLGSIFMHLVVEAERDIRARLAEKLAAAPWAPVALVNVLALDEIEIARPIIAQSPVLQDHDLIRLLVEATLEHQIEVAKRPRLGQPVVAAILVQAEPAVLTALADNPTAELSTLDMARLIAASRKIAALRSPLARHPKLNEELAQKLYVWVGQALRRQIAGRFRLDMEELDAALADSVREAHGGVEGHDNDDEAEPPPTSQRVSNAVHEERLVAKLAQAGQLRPAFLLRALKEGQLGLFEAALCTLGGFERSQISRAIDSERPDLLALACAAVGIDRSVYPTILGLVRDLNGGRPNPGEAAKQGAAAFGVFDPKIAQAAFRQAVAAV